MKAVIISGGNRVSVGKVKSVMENCNVLLCADRGTDYALSYGLSPDYVIGDMDSVSELTLKSLEGTNVLKSSPEKDFTDTHLAVKKAIDIGCDDIDILCATGLRSDHGLANIRLLLFISKSGCNGRIIDDENTIYLCNDKIDFINKKGKTVSLLSIDCHTEGITLDGFKYPLVDYNAGLDWIYGISNEIESDKASLKIKKGSLLVFEIED